mmetsp:Transcript_22139/g.37576  ORF Transcript_22139/g.37576 Transcript_22139/m.37576 type:complete len:306 (+) Transcript_22139:72-989(+)
MDPVITDSDTEATIRERYQQEIQTCRKLEGQVVLIKRKVEQAQKDKDHAANALVRIENVKNKLEGVCRQLQKQSKAIEDESLVRAREDKDQRSDLTTKFHQTIEDITKRMDEHNGDKDMLLKDKQLLHDRIKNLEEQLELRDQHYAQQIKTKELQMQLISTRLRQQTEIFEQDEFRRSKYRERLLQQSQAEDQLRQQLQMYGAKFEQFQETLQNSNKMFENFQRDLGKMMDRSKALLAENRSVKVKAAKAEKMLNEMQDEESDRKQKLKQAETQNTKLKNLVALLQKEIAGLEASPAAEQNEQSS